MVLLCPGFIFLQRREQFHSGVTYTALRETSLVLLASMATLVISVGVLGTERLIAPESTPDLGRYVREFDAYFKAHYVEAATWGLGVLTDHVRPCILDCGPAPLGRQSSSQGTPPRRR